MAHWRAPQINNVFKFILVSLFLIFNFYKLKIVGGRLWSTVVSMGIQELSYSSMPQQITMHQLSWPVFWGLSLLTLYPQEWGWLGYSVRAFSCLIIILIEIFTEGTEVVKIFKLPIIWIWRGDLGEAVSSMANPYTTTELRGCGLMRFTRVLLHSTILFGKAH